jgi:PAS domain S-box-containing protein
MNPANEAHQQGQVDAMLQLRVAALDVAANSIVITDQRGIIQWVNTAFTKLTGYSAAEAVGRIREC